MRWYLKDGGILYVLRDEHDQGALAIGLGGHHSHYFLYKKLGLKYLAERNIPQIKLDAAQALAILELLHTKEPLGKNVKSSLELFNELRDGIFKELT